MIPWIKPGSPADSFPPIGQALTEPDGLLCAGGDLSPERLLAAYSRGIFPWYSPGQPVLWWSPDPRMVLYPHELHVSHSLRKTLRRGKFRVTVDTCFDAVMVQCAESGMRADEGTWISPDMRAAYGELHRRGHAHSIEVWLDDAEEGSTGSRLVGGLYGLLLGPVFFGESMFSTETDASKVALHALVQWLPGVRQDIELIDCQVASEHLFTLGARLIPRAQFIAHLGHGITAEPTA